MIDQKFTFMSLSALLQCMCALASIRAAAPTETIDFNRDIRPIFSNNCYACHGPDQNQRKADLRLDTQEGAFAQREDYSIITPGKLEESELYWRISSDLSTERMPPAKSGKSLSADQIALVKRWIEQGAEWNGHWAYAVPKRPTVQVDRNDAWSSNEIDRFIYSRLNHEGLNPGKPADRRTLARRLSFDLLGLPPTREEVEQFSNDSSPGSSAKFVNRLLASPHFGERMAVFWLDLVRFADTVGYHSDTPRNVFPYRDYVIESFNSNKPFDQFTIEQLAGDLLPDAGLEQSIASGYNRLLQTTEEGGAQPREYAAKYMTDRVRNFSAVWLGSTMGCAECHDHKFDPTSTRDFYSLAAFFADVQETPVGRREPGILVADEDQIRHLEAFKARRATSMESLKRPALHVAAAALLGRFPPTIYDSEIFELKRIADEEKDFLKTVPRTLATVAMKPRTIRVLPRGNWMDDSGPVVEPAIPEFLGQMEIEDRRPSRLDLARWVVDRKNPLTARVFMNRLWKLFFGEGLSRSMEDFGAQGEQPSHPELLDWLAVEFMESGWDVKHMVKLIVMSSTYQLSSIPIQEQIEKDPENRLLARQARFRLDAEFVRDNALAISGLLVKKVGGDSVKPYQPRGYWEFLNFPKRIYRADKGTAQYRRGLYSHWQRTFLHPSLLAFDAPTREECTAERPRSNIPQQALVLLNDPTYVEAARAFAARIIREGGESNSERLEWAYRQALSRSMTKDEKPILSELLVDHLKHYQQHPDAGQELIQVGQMEVTSEVDVAEWAAWTSVARAIFSLHEMVTRE